MSELAAVVAFYVYTVLSAILDLSTMVPLVSKDMHVNNNAVLLFNMCDEHTSCPRGYERECVGFLLTRRSRQ